MLLVAVSPTNYSQGRRSVNSSVRSRVQRLREWLLTPSVALRAEGLYYWFDQKDSAPGERGFGGIQDTWVARVGASWYFNGSRPVDDMYGAMAGDAFSGFYVGAHTGYGSADYKG